MNILDEPKKKKSKKQTLYKTVLKKIILAVLKLKLKSTRSMEAVEYRTRLCRDGIFRNLLILCNYFKEIQALCN